MITRSTVNSNKTQNIVAIINWEVCHIALRYLQFTHYFRNYCHMRQPNSCNSMTNRCLNYYSSHKHRDSWNNGLELTNQQKNRMLHVLYMLYELRTIKKLNYSKRCSNAVKYNGGISKIFGMAFAPSQFIPEYPGMQ